MRKILPFIGIWAINAVLGTFGTSELEAQTWRTMSSARQVWETAPTDVEIEYGVGRLTVKPGDPSMLYQMVVRYDEESFAPVAEWDERERKLHLGVRGIDNDRHSMNRRKGSSATIGLAREVPLNLDLEFGAGTANIELGGIMLQQLALSTGASETRVSFSEPNKIAAGRVAIEAGAADLEVTGLGNARATSISFQGGVGATVLDFGGEWGGDITADVDMGVGSLTLRLPRSQGIRVVRESFLSTFDAAGMERNGDSYFSSNWRTAEHHLTIDVSTALGSVEIDWID
jgi:hypothetical protein